MALGHLASVKLTRDHNLGFRSNPRGGVFNLL